MHLQIPPTSCFAAALAIFMLAACPRAAVDPDNLLERADRALYKSKQTGRNKLTKLRRPAAEVHSVPVLL
jgi:predicted signal transduction protein with EAL and GGDEF domain